MTTTPINGSTEPQIDIAAEFSHPSRAHTNGSTTIPTNGSTKHTIDIATKVSHHHDPVYTNGSINTHTNGSTITPINGFTKLAIHKASEFSNHDPAYTNGSTNTLTNCSTTIPINGSTKHTFDIATESYHHDPAYTTTPIDISTEFSHQDPTVAGLSNNATSLNIATEFSHHDTTYARLNNGSFGCCPSTIIAAQQKWQLKFLENPDYFYFNTLQPSLLKSRHAIKTLINASHVDEISILDNVTTAAAIVLRHTAWSFISGDLNSGDSVLILQKAYGAVKKSVGAYVSRAGGKVIEVPLPFPVTSNEEIFTEFRNALKKGKSKNGVQKIKLAIIDHVTSMPCMVIPVKELVQICRNEGVEKIFIDGAHGVGCVHVDVTEIGADFYTSSLYKWFFCPPSAAFLHCRNAADSMALHHPVVSHEYGNGLPLESGWIGTRDYSPQCMIPDVLDFMMERFEGGIEGIRGRNHEKVVAMGEMLAKAWGGTGLGAPPEMCASMVMVGLPGCLGVSSDGDACDLMELLRNRFRILAPVCYREPLEGDGVGVVTGYVRISHQVYNKVEEYFRLRDAVNKLVEDGFSYKANKGIEIKN